MFLVIVVLSDRAPMRLMFCGTNGMFQPNSEAPIRQPQQFVQDAS